MEFSLDLLLEVYMKSLHQNLMTSKIKYLNTSKQVERIIDSK